MRALVIMISSLIVGCGTAVAQGRTHLKVLSDIPESHVRENAVAGLGVTCELAVQRAESTPSRVWIWDRDDSHQRRDIHGPRTPAVGGRPVVTATCHQGSIVLRVVAAARPKSNNASGAAPPRATVDGRLANLPRSREPPIGSDDAGSRDGDPRACGQVRSFRGRDRYRSIGRHGRPITAVGRRGRRRGRRARGRARRCRAAASPGRAL